MSSSKRTIRALHYFSDHIIADYGDGKVFQFCTACKHGRHIKAFLNHFCPQLDVGLITPELGILLEKRFFNILNHGPVRRMINKEAYAFGEYVAKRCERERTLAERRKQRAERAALKMQNEFKAC